MSQVQRGHIIGFNFTASPTAFFESCGPFCIEQKFSNPRKVPLKNIYRGFSPGTVAVLEESGHYSCSPQGPRCPIGRNVLWGLVLFLCSVPSYHVSEGLNTLRCWCVLVLILEKEKNQAVTLRSRPVKNNYIFSFLQRTDHSKWPPLSFFLMIQNTGIGLSRLF